ncbi:unnamed protein product, partial [Mycena citricolor]
HPSANAQTPSLATERSASQLQAARGRTSFRGRSFSGLPNPPDVNPPSSHTSPDPISSPPLQSEGSARSQSLNEAGFTGETESSVNPEGGDPMLHPVQEVDESEASPVPMPFDPLMVIQCVLILCAWLHTEHHVSFRAISLLLWAVDFVLRFLPGNILGDNTLPKTLKTTLACLSIHDQFKIHPICPSCHSIFPEVSPVDSKCPTCDTAIYRVRSQSMLDRLTATVTGAGSGNDDDSDMEASTDAPAPESSKHSDFKPVAVAPILLLSDALQGFFERPGMVEAVQEWKTKSHSDEKLESIQDGEIWKTQEAADGSRFFYDEGIDELRIGVSFGIDWFGRKSSHYGPSHSSGVLSFCVQNLSPELRYRPENLIVVGMPPGPTEPTSPQLQNYSKIIVNNLIKLFEDGILIDIPGRPKRRYHVRVALISIIADHPAMCKIAGFADHGHKNAPCHKCKVCKAEMFTAASLQNKFPGRTKEEHNQLAKQYRDLETEAEKDAFFMEHGVRWSEFVRLEYFDIIRCTVIDPMHNLLLGVAKTQWYSIWIKEKVLRPDTNARERELHFIHNILEMFECPSWTGHLPLRVGKPAGGSLTADEYKFSVTAPWAIIIPVVWDIFRPKEHEHANEQYQQKKAEYDSELRTWQRKRIATRGDPPQPPSEPVYRMKIGEEENFLRFATALKIIIGSAIYREMIPRASSLLEDYLLGFLEARLLPTESRI